MKKYAITLMLLVSACATTPYEYSSKSLISDGEGRTVCIISTNKNIETTQLKMFFAGLLERHNFKLISDFNKCRYRFGFNQGGNIQSFKTTVAEYGATGIKSINTNSSGRIDGFANTYYDRNGSDTFYNGRIASSSTTSIDYNYGITGYHDQINYVINKEFNVLMLDTKINDIVYEAHINIDEMPDKSEFSSNVMSIFSQNRFLSNGEKKYTCADGVCSEASNWQVTNENWSALAKGAASVPMY